MSPVSNPYRRSAAILAVVILGSVLVALPGVAKNGRADHPARYSACVGDALESAGFSDMVGHQFEGAVNCLAYYGIALGRTTDLYSPTDPVKRVQMARFLWRAARLADIPLPTAANQRFNDLDGIDADTQNMINQVAALGIMEGYSRTRWEPNEPVTRQDMAAHLYAFLQAGIPGPGTVEDFGDIDPDDTVFDDLDDAAGYAYQPIRRVYELGITKGKTANMFAPSDTVTRGQMAAFITRTLAHTNLRPEGITIQVDDSEVHDGKDLKILVSLRDEQFEPIADEYVDVFTDSDPDRTFEDNGTCTARPDAVEGGTPCTIDSGDLFTDGDGNVELERAPDNQPATFWAWTAEDDDTFDVDRTAHARVDIGAIPRAEAIKVTDDMKETAEALPFGETVTFTFQLVDGDGDAVELDGVEIDLIVRTTDPGSSRRSTSQETIETDGTGRVSWTYTPPADPSADEGDVARLDFDPRARFSFIDETTVNVVVPSDGGTDHQLEWIDEETRPTSLVLTLPQGAYQEASDTDSGPSNQAQVRLTDQYGDPISGSRVRFYSSDSEGLPWGRTRTTGGNGIATVTYRRDSEATGAEQIWAELDDGRPRSNTVRHYWVREADDGETGAGNVRVADTAKDRVVVSRSGGDYVVLEYDNNDQYSTRESSDDPYVAINKSRFEELLDAGDSLAFDISDTRTAEVNVFRLTSPPETG